MKVRKSSKPMKRVIPKDPSNGVYEDKVHEWVGKVDVVDVDDLLSWCKDNPDVTAKDLADSFERGAFA